MTKTAMNLLCLFAFSFTGTAYGSDNGDLDCNKVQASADCGKESKDLRKSCDDDLGSAVRTNQLVSNAYAPAAGDGPEAIGKKQAGVLRAHQTNWKNADEMCSSRRRDLAKACSCAHRKANERYEEAKRMAERTKNDPRVSQKYKDEADREWRGMADIRRNYKETDEAIQNNRRTLASEIGKGNVGAGAGDSISRTAGAR